jgi:hypothetical protein
MCVMTVRTVCCTHPRPGNIEPYTAFSGKKSCCKHMVGHAGAVTAAGVRRAVASPRRPHFRRHAQACQPHCLRPHERKRMPRTVRMRGRGPLSCGVPGPMIRCGHRLQHAASAIKGAKPNHPCWHGAPPPLLESDGAAPSREQGGIGQRVLCLRPRQKRRAGRGKGGGPRGPHAERDAGAPS